MKRLALLTVLIVAVASLVLAAAFSPKSEATAGRVAEATRVKGKFENLALGNQSPATSASPVQCDVSVPGPPMWILEGFILGQEWYFALQDPVASGCTAGYPFAVTDITVMLYASGPCVTGFSVQLYSVNEDSPTCPKPGYAFYVGSAMTLELPGEGQWMISIDLGDTVCVSDEYYVALYFPEPVACLGLVTDESPMPCWNYVLNGGALYDLPDLGSPGRMQVFSTGLPSDDASCLWSAPQVEISHPDDGACFGDSIEFRAVDWSNSGSVSMVEFQHSEGTGWVTFATDFDGTSCYGDTYPDTIPCEDGWSGVLDAVSLPPGDYLVRVVFHDVIFGQIMDTITVSRQPYSHEIEIVDPPISNDILFTCAEKCTVKVESKDPDPPAGQPVADVSNEPEQYERNVPEIQQGADVLEDKNVKSEEDEDGYYWVVNSGCVPTAFTSCLKWLASIDDGAYRCITQKRDANGDPIPDEYLSDEELAESLWTAMGTQLPRPNGTDPPEGGGTDYNKVKPALERWFERKCPDQEFVIQDLWKDTDLKIDRYIEELKKKNEDVVVARDGHAMTANSYKVEQVAEEEKKTIDVMDPAKPAGENPVWMDWPTGNDEFIRMWVVSPKESKKIGTDLLSHVKTSQTREGRFLHEFVIDSSQLFQDSITLVTVTMENAQGCTDKDVVILGLRPQYICGDPDASGGVDIDDVVYLIAYIFSGGPAPIPYESGDADCSGTVDIDDVVYLINYIFSGGNPPCDMDGNGVPDC